MTIWTAANSRWAGLITAFRSSGTRAEGTWRTSERSSRAQAVPKSMLRGGGHEIPASGKLGQAGRLGGVLGGQLEPHEHEIGRGDTGELHELLQGGNRDGAPRVDDCGTEVVPAARAIPRPQAQAVKGKGTPRDPPDYRPRHCKTPPASIAWSSLRTSPAPGSVSSIDKGVAPARARLALLSQCVAASRAPKVAWARRVMSATRTTRSEAAASRLRLSLISLCAVLSGVCRRAKMTAFGTSRYATMSSTTRAPTPARMISIFCAAGVSRATNSMKGGISCLDNPPGRPRGRSRACRRAVPAPGDRFMGLRRLAIAAPLSGSG